VNDEVFEGGKFDGRFSKKNIPGPLEGQLFIGRERKDEIDPYSLRSS
jgi:hypothetical protein